MGAEDALRFPGRKVRGGWGGLQTQEGGALRMPGDFGGGGWGVGGAGCKRRGEAWGAEGAMVGCPCCQPSSEKEPLPSSFLFPFLLPFLLLLPPSFLSPSTSFLRCLC